MDAVDVSTPDIISTLPNNLLENILVRLPIRDAVRTSVLSKKWAHIWETLPELDFNITTFGEGMSHEELLLTIFQILLIHRGPILKFKLTVPRLKVCHHIDHIMKFLSKNGIQTLNLSIWNNEHYKVPSCIFSCLELRHLDFFGCSLEPFSKFNGLRNLVTLTCHNVTFNTKFFDNLSKNFPSLERLTLKDCLNIEHLNIHAPNLKHLDIDSVFQSISFKETWQLKTALVEGPGVGMPNVDDASLRRGVTIAELSSCCHGTINFLYIGHPLLKILAAGYVPPRLLNDFDCLEYIIFRDLCFQVKAEIQCAFCFIRSSPYLQQIYIQVYRGQDGDTNAVMEYLKDNDRDDFAFHRLKVVVMMSYKGSEAEMEFVKLVLARSPLLKTMFIKFHEDADTEEKLRIVSQLTRFCRASPAAVLDCTYNLLDWSRLKLIFSVKCLLNK